MKRSLLYSFAILSVVGTGCAKLQEDLLEADIASEQVIMPDPSNNFVTIKQISTFAERVAPETKYGGEGGFVIEAYRSHESDTLMYIINYEGGNGWKIVSADARTPAIIAEGERGSFSLETENPGPSLWMKGIAEDMEIIRHSKDESLAFSKEEIQLNRAFWSGDAPRVIDPPVIDDEGGHWEVTTTSSTIVYDLVDHMVPQWDQWSPYNKYCPLGSSGGSSRAPAGCVAIAGAQLLYFLNHKFGVPENMYSSASCTGNVGSFLQNFSGLSNTVWSTMLNTYDGTSSRSCTEAILIAYVGSLLHMHYGDESSYAFDIDLKPDVFNSMGINCSHGVYNETTVKNSLLSGLPVIVSACSALLPVFDWGSGHCFVIDGYKRTRTRYTHHHVWVPDDPASFYDPNNEYASYTTTTYSSPQMTGIKINWGWWSQWRPNNPLNDGWYTLTGGWHTVLSDGTSSNYNYYRSMTYGFSIT